MVVNKAFFYIFFLIIFSSLVIAQPPFQENLNVLDNELEIIYPKTEFFKFGQDFDIHFHVVDSNSSPILNTDFYCLIHVYDGENNHVLVGSTSDSGSNLYDDEITLNTSIITDYGWYTYNLLCNSSGVNQFGFVSTSFKMTRSGESDETSIINLNMLVILFMFIGMSVISLWVSTLFNTEEFSTLRLVFFWMAIINLLVMTGFFALITNCDGTGCNSLDRFNPVSNGYFTVYALFTVYVLWNYTFNKLKKSNSDWVVKK